MGEEEPGAVDLAERLVIVEKKLDRLTAKLSRRFQLRRGFNRFGFLAGAGVVVFITAQAWFDNGAGAAGEAVFGGIFVGGATWLLVYLIGWVVEGFGRD